MGYTHYWSNAAEFRPEAWAALCETARKIIDESGVKVVWECDETDREPTIDDICIRFNGPDEDGHETFLLNRFHEDFAFCKTARKPYDVVVAAVLMAAAEYSTGFTWRSDGYGRDGRDPSGETVYNDHGEALALYNKVTGNGLKETNADLD